jgi:hypothetical protein
VDAAPDAPDRRRGRTGRREARLRARAARELASALARGEGSRLPRDVTAHRERYLTDAPVEAAPLGQLPEGGRGSVAFWFQPHWQAGNQDDASLVDLAGGQLQLRKNVNFLRLELTDVDGRTHAIGAPISHWKTGEWQQVAGSWDVNVFQLYLDGQLMREASIDGVFLLPEEARVLVGSDFPPHRPIAPGVIGGLQVYGRPLSPDEALHRFLSAVAG